MSTIPQNPELLKHLFARLQAHRDIFKPERTYQRVVALVLAEVFVFARHPVTQLLMSLGETDRDWSIWYCQGQCRPVCGDRRGCLAQPGAAFFRFVNFPFISTQYAALLPAFDLNRL